MTKKDLQMLKHMNFHLRNLRAHLVEMRATIGITAATDDGQPKGNKVGSPTETQALKIQEQVEKIEALIVKIDAAKLEAWDLIMQLKDPMLKDIIILRFVDGKSWFDVSQAIGGDATADGCRMYFNRSKEIAD